MNERRKKIILSELDYWKRNKLLPAHYCDFLSALYTGGEDTEEKGKPHNASILYKEKRNRLFQLVMLVVLSLIIALVMYIMSDFSSLLVGTGAIILLLGFAWMASKKKSALLPFVYIASAFLLLAMSLKLWSLYFADQAIVLIGLLIVNCVLWLFTGRLFKLLYFTLSGSFGLIAIILFIFFQ